MPRVGDGKLLAFCRAGTRSALAWALARAEHGAAARSSGGWRRPAIDLGPVAHLL